MPFLDVLLQRCDDGSITTSVYRKATHTDKYLDFSSHHPLMHKMAVVRTLFSRANTLSSSTAHVRKECQQIHDALKHNHYPASFIKRTSRRRPTETSCEEECHEKTIVLPYVRGLSEAIKRTLLSANIRVVFQPYTTLRKELVRVKDPTLPGKKANVVYKIPCSECPAVYIGQTGRLLETRIAEHKTAVKHARCDVSAVADHVWNKQHQMDFNEVSILAQEKNQQQRCYLESWFIQTNNTINREVGSLLPVYGCLFYFFTPLFIFPECLFFVFLYSCVFLYFYFFIISICSCIPFFVLPLRRTKRKWLKRLIYIFPLILASVC